MGILDVFGASGDREYTRQERAYHRQQEEERARRYIVGLDLGQRDDYTALASYIGSKLVDKNAQTLDRERLADTDALVAALEEEFGRREGGVA